MTQPSALIIGAGPAGLTAGLELLRDTTPDLIVTDLFMPNIDGLEVIRRVRNDHVDLPIIAISGGGRGQASVYLSAAKLFGNVSILTKPIKPKVLIREIEQSLSQAG